MKLKIAFIAFIISISSWSQITEGFESGLPTAYTATTTYTLSSGTWTGQANGVIRGTAGVKSGLYSCQLRSQTGAQITSPMIISGGLGTVTFWASSSTATGSVQVNYRINGGAWTPATGSPFSLNTTVTQYVATVNDGSANIEFQFYRTAATVYIDDVSTTTFSSCTPPSNPTGSITGTTPACASTVLTHTAPSSSTYWQTSATGTSTANPTTSTYTASSTGTYYVRNYDGVSCWSTGNLSYAVTVVSAPNITTQPVNRSITEGANTTFNVTSSFTSAYQWQVSTDGGATFTNISDTGVYTGSATATLTITAAPYSMNGYQYQCVLTGNSPCTTVNTTIRTLTVTPSYPGCYFVNFEDGSSKIGYPSDDITLNTKVWNLSEALISNTAGDFGTSYGVRMRATSNGALTLMEDKTDGISTVSFDFKQYTTTPNNYTNQVFNVEYSKDSGNSWFLIGMVIPSVFSPTQTFNGTVNQSGAIRFRIRFGSGTEEKLVRLNIDNLLLCDYSNTKEIEVFGNNTTIQDNSTTTTSINDTNFSDEYFVGDPTITKVFTIKNYGTGTLNLSGLSISGSSDFSITSGLSSTTLAAGASATFSVSFSSASSGYKLATITINNDDTDEAVFNFNISALSNNYVKCALQAKSTIAHQDFDGINSLTYTYDTPAVIAAGTNYGDNRTTKTNMFIGGNSFQVNNNTLGIYFDSVDASQYKNIDLSFNIGAYATGTAGGLETSDKAKVYISLNGGATWTEILNITGNSNSIFDVNNSLSVTSVVFNSALQSPYRFGPTASSTNTLTSRYKITGITPSGSLKVKIILSSNSTAEIWTVDEVKIEGQLPESTTWQPSLSWSAGAPINNKKAIIDANYDTNSYGNIHACECQVNASKTVNVTNSGYLEIQSNITNNGTIYVEDNSSIVQVNDAAVNTGNIIMDRIATIKNKDYVYWSSPVEGTIVNTISPLTPTSKIFKWNPTIANPNAGYGNWESANGNTMEKGRGYILRGPSTFSNTVAADLTATFTGKMYNGIIDVPVARENYTGTGYSGTNGITITNWDDNYNLVGNPYPSAIKALDFINTNNNIEGAVRIWTHGNLPSTLFPNPFYNSFVYNYTANDYIVHNGTGTISGPSGFNGYIAAGQGFFILMEDGPADATQYVTFNNSMRNKTYNNSQFYRNANTNLDSIEKHRIWLDLIDANSQTSRTLLGYVEGATANKDRLFDAYTSTGNYLNIYTLIDSQTMGIQGRALPFDENDQVPLGFTAPTAGNYSIAIAGVDGLFNTQTIYLEDNQLNTIHNLSTAPYNFTANSGVNTSRFVLRYTSNALNTTSFSNDNNVWVSSQNHSITIKSLNENLEHIVIYDILGRELLIKKNINALETTINSLPTTTQSLVVKITLKDGSVTTKKIVF